MGSQRSFTVRFDGINLSSQRSRLGPIERHPFSVFYTYNTQSSTVVLRSCCPVPVLARTSTGRVGLRNTAVREFACSGEGRQSRFWGMSAAARLLASTLLLLVPGVGARRNLHCIERDDYINKAPCRFRVFPALPLGTLILLQSL